MTNEYNTQILELSKQIDNCSDVLSGFSSFLITDDNKQNASIDFILKQQSKELNSIAKQFLQLLSK
jgi:hypothetical protein